MEGEKKRLLKKLNVLENKQKAKKKFREDLLLFQGDNIDIIKFIVEETKSTEHIPKKLSSLGTLRKIYLLAAGIIQVIFIFIFWWRYQLTRQHTQT